MILERLRRTFDPARFNEIANHPDVRPWLGGADGPLDLSPVVGDPANVAFIGEGAGFICHKIGDGRYEVHSMALPEARGAGTIELVREGMRFMFCATDCTELVTKCPDGNAAALGIARASGFQEIFRREHCWPFRGDMVGVSYQSITFDRWRARDPIIAERGDWFHAKLECAKLAKGSTLPVHAEDEAHDRAVGAAVLMVLAGNPRKAVWSYNRWAIFAGYAPIMLLSESPAVLDVADAIVTPNGAEMEVLLCR